MCIVKYTIINFNIKIYYMVKRRNTRKGKGWLHKKIKQIK